MGFSLQLLYQGGEEHGTYLLYHCLCRVVAGKEGSMFWI